MQERDFSLSPWLDFVDFWPSLRMTQDGVHYKFDMYVEHKRLDMWRSKLVYLELYPFFMFKFLDS